MNPDVCELGHGTAYAVRSTSHPERTPYLVMYLGDGRWVCSCRADHARLSREGRYCSTITKVQDRHV